MIEMNDIKLSSDAVKYIFRLPLKSKSELLRLLASSSYGLRYNTKKGNEVVIHWLGSQQPRTKGK